ncbi:MAG: hypothetical protein H6605_01625 [Flavobacteriales bacterium]|nr:hypothetical protein [Flavobacteriales bacterium]
MNYFRLRRFVLKWTHYEYWPWLFFYIPVIPVYLYYAIRARYFYFNTAANPGIDLGGLFGESKIGILDHIDPKYKALTQIHVCGENIDETLEKIQRMNFKFPVILKPNKGQRGDQVFVIQTFDQIREILAKDAIDFLIQEYVNYSYELGVLYGRLPNETKGSVRSIVMKNFLTVTGDGKQNVRQLLLNNPRAWFQMERFEKEIPEILNQTPGKNTEVLVEPVGNHCKGTEFINANHLITDDLHEVFDRISGSFKGFYYGRYDLRAESLEAFSRGESIKVFELNGVTSDPGHIFDKNYPLLKAYRDLYRELGFIYQVSVQNIKKGVKPLSFRFITKLLWGHFRNRKKLGTLFVKP